MARTKVKEETQVSIDQAPSKPQYGYIYPAFNTFINMLRYVSLVEGFKYIGKRFAAPNAIQKVNYSRLAVDIFITLKWLFVAILWAIKATNFWLILAVWYLLIANIYTYFYYHTWSGEVLSGLQFDIDRVKRRFTTLILAISYSIFGFAFLYSVPYSSHFHWGNVEPAFLPALWFSVSNSLTASYDQVRPATDFGSSIAMIQLLMMFVFLTIIIGGSIPQPNLNGKEG